MRGAVLIELKACSNNCIFCGSQRKVGAIPKKEMREIEKDFLKHAMELSKGGFDELQISGNDPVEYPKIASFVKLLRRKLGFRHVQLSTHGRNLEDRGLVDDLRRAGVNEYRIPLYGATAGVHDGITQSKGSFRQALQGIKNIRSQAKQARVIITSLLMRQNCSEAVDTLRLASSYADEVVISIPCVTSVERARKFTLSFRRLSSVVLKLLKEARRLGKQLTITDVPFCVTGGFREELINQTAPLPMAPSYSVPEAFRTGRHGFPSYRIKRKLSHCDRCRMTGLCDGFYELYLKMYDAGQFQWLK